MMQGTIFNESRHRAAYGILLFLFASILCAIPACLQAQTPEDEILQKIGVNEKLDSIVPLDLTFTNQDGRQVRLRDYFTGEPVILTLNYYECPMLCPLVFRSLVDAMGKMQGLSLNKDFRIVTVSFNPDETPARSKAKALETYRMLRGVTNVEDRWPFLMGDEASIARLTGSVGFRYVKLGKDNFAHPAVSVILTPDGSISRYLYGVEVAPTDLKLALIEAADGRIGGSRLVNQVLLYCFHYDPVGKKYAVTAINLMKITGAAVLTMLVILIVVLKRSEKRNPEWREGSKR
jgi:protein SCO1/2